MEKVNMDKEFTKLSEADKYFVRKLEQMNRDRAKDMKHLRRKNWFTALAIGTGVLSICILSEVKDTYRQLVCQIYCIIFTLPRITWQNLLYNSMEEGMTQ